MIFALAILVAGDARGQDGESDANVAAVKRNSPTAINRRVTNPVSTTWSLKLQNNIELLDFGTQGIHTRETVQFQPTMPILLSEWFKLIARPQFTLIDDT